MAEYNLQYLDLKRRLQVLKFLTDSDMNLSEEFRLARLALIDHLLKDLDRRYEEGKHLDSIEDEIDGLK